MLLLMNFVFEIINWGTLSSRHYRFGDDEYDKNTLRIRIIFVKKMIIISFEITLLPLQTSGIFFAFILIPRKMRKGRN